MNIVMLDNRDSFVYNLVDALQKVQSQTVKIPGANLGTGAPPPVTEVYRNDLPARDIVGRAEELEAIICLSPGPGTPEAAGCLFDVIKLAQSRGVPLLGICLGFQALLGVSGGKVERVGPVHGTSSNMKPTEAGYRVFGLTRGERMPVARYHSLGCYRLPDQWENWGTVDKIVMAAGSKRLQSCGVQFHPESVLTQGGGRILRSMLDFLKDPC